MRTADSEMTMCSVFIVSTLSVAHFSSVFDYGKNLLRDFLLLLVFSNIHLNKLTRRLSKAAQISTRRVAIEPRFEER